MKVLGFAGSNSSLSINKQLVEYTCSLLSNSFKIEILDLNNFEMPLFGIDRENENGIPEKAYTMANKIDSADLIVLSLAEHNGTYSTAFKNIYDWISRIPNRSVWNKKKLFLMSTSEGERGGESVLNGALTRFPWDGGEIVSSYSFPSFSENFKKGEGILDATLKAKLLENLKLI